MKRIPIAAIVIASVAVLLIGGFMYRFVSLFGVQNTVVEQAHAYEEAKISSDDGLYTLRTIVTQDDTGVYASFEVLDEGGMAVYRCPDRYRTMDLKSIDWLTGYDIEVYSGDVGRILYQYEDGGWRQDDG